MRKWAKVFWASLLALATSTFVGHMMPDAWKLAAIAAIVAFTAMTAWSFLLYLNERNIEEGCF